MIHCLEIPELIELIFNSISLDPSNEQGLPTLAALATTCKRFSGPAIAILWESQLFLTSLVKCLPQELWVDDKEKSRKVELRLTNVRPILPEDWDRFDFYAPHVKRLGWENRRRDQWSYPGRIHETVFAALHERRKDTQRPLLPNLEELQFRDDSSVLFPSIRDLVGPELSRLVTRVNAAPGIEVKLLFELISSTCVKFETLELDGADYGTAKPMAHIFTPFFTNTIPTLPRLRKLIIPDMFFSLETLKYLAGSDIQSLRLLNPLEEVFELHQPEQRHLYPSLTEILGDISTLENASDILLSRLANPQLLTNISLELQGEMHPNVKSFDLVLRSILSQCSQTTLEHLQFKRIFMAITVHTPENVDLNGNNMLLTIDNFKPFLNFSQLKIVDFSLEFAYNLNDAELEKMAIAWPNLEALRLGTGYWLDLSRLTLRSLRALAKHCKYLLHIVIALDVNPDDLEDEDDDDEGIAQPHCDSLMYLSMGNSTVVDDVSRVAKTLEGLFPKLRMMQAFYHWTAAPPLNVAQQLKDEKCKEIWQAVADVMPGTRRRW